MATVEDLKSLERMLASLGADKKQELMSNPLVDQKLKKVWKANPGQQRLALESEADELFYGGQAGGGKTDLLMGLSLTEHKKSLLLRRTNKEASRFINRFSEIVGHRDGYNGQLSTFRLPDRFIEFGGCQLEDDKQKYKGDPKDFIGWDEISDFTETQFRFVNGWNRSADKSQRCRVVAAGNPPTTPEGLWVIKYWGPWLDPNHPNPAKPGELRWFTTIKGEDVEVDGRGPHEVNGELIPARSRTFIPATLGDNPDLAETDYNAVLSALPEELRRAYKEGRFDAALSDHEWQVIPTEWVIAAQERWEPDGWRGNMMTAIGMDCSGGGKDAAPIAPRYGGWYGEIVAPKGEITADGTAMCAEVMKIRRDGCPIVVDVGGGFAGAVIERFKDNGIAYHKYDGSGKSIATALGTGLKFHNKRAEAHWKFREALDPDQEGGSVIALPPDTELRADLCATRYELGPSGIKMEPKVKVKERIGRSPDKGDSVIMALSEGNKAAIRRLGTAGAMPKVKLGYAGHKGNRR